MSDLRKVFMEFLGAARQARQLGAPINPLAAAGQACLESGFGRFTPPGSNNVLGIKAGSSWTGPVVHAKTHEYSEGGRVDNVSAWWRVYPSVADCFVDYGRIIGGRWWFADAARHADGDPLEYLLALQPLYGPDGKAVLEPGYFTDPAYVEKAMRIVTAYGLPEQSPFDETYPPLEGVTELWVNNELRASVVKARQVNHKLFVTTTTPIKK